MKLKLITILLLIFTSFALQADEYYQTGDIIFQTSEAKTNKAIELATHSKFSHVGIIFNYLGNLQVLEATQPVSITPLSKFIDRSAGGKYAVLRLKSAEQILTDDLKEELIAKGKSWVGKNYDFVFSWNDDELYCSELVYKLYEFVLDIQLAQPKPLKSFDLSHPLVQEQLKLKYGKNIPYDDNMISPQQLYESDLLMPVTTHL
jgi:cell wall-associated NlpC family hydrolase